MSHIDCPNKIAIYQGFHNMHFEMIGYLIDFTKTHGFKYDVYAHIGGNTEAASWFEFYRDLFGKDLVFLAPHTIGNNLGEYKTIVILTDDDYSFSESWKNVCKQTNIQLVYIDHCKDIRCDAVAIHIGTRPFLTGQPAKQGWALPTYAVVGSMEEKLGLINHEEPLVVGIGSACITGTAQLQSLFGETFHEIDYVFMGRSNIIARLGFDTNCDGNIKVMTNVLTNDMHAVLKRATHILFTQEGEYTKYLMSGALPLAFNYGLQVIMPQSWQEEYNFESIMVYKPGDVITIDMKRYMNEDLETIFKEQNALIAHRNTTFCGLCQHICKREKQ
jgi:hypothetical protein